MSDEIHRIAGALPSAEALNRVVDALETEGFDRAQFGVLASRDALPAGESAAEIAADPNVRTDANSEPETEGALSGAIIGGLMYAGAATAAGLVVLSGGGLGIALAALIGAGGASGLVAGLVAHGFHQQHAEFIEDQVSRGGVVLWIQPRDAAQAKTATEQLKAEGAEPIITQGA
jgi:hypothetical protein